jgi:hypothetical protein
MYVYVLEKMIVLIQYSVFGAENKLLISSR